MNIFFYLTTVLNSDLETEVDNLREKIMYIDEAVRFNFAVYWTVLGIALTMIGICLAILMTIKIKSSKQFIKEEVAFQLKDSLDDLVNKLHYIETLSGSKLLHKTEMKGSECSFIIGSKDLNISFEGLNSIDLTPLQGTDKLNFGANVKGGELFIDFDNFDVEKHKGFNWKIRYFLPK